jgi:hypothetical protein
MTIIQKLSKKSWCATPHESADVRQGFPGVVVCGAVQISTEPMHCVHLRALRDCGSNASPAPWLRLGAGLRRGATGLAEIGAIGKDHLRHLAVRRESPVGYGRGLPWGAGFGQPFTGWKVQRHGTAVCAGRRTGEGQAVRRGGRTGWAMRGRAEWPRCALVRWRQGR